MNPIPCSVWIRLLHQGLWQLKANYSLLLMLLLNTRRMERGSHVSAHKRSHVCMQCLPTQCFCVIYIRTLFISCKRVEEPQLLKSTISLTVGTPWLQRWSSHQFITTPRGTVIFTACNFQLGHIIRGPNMESAVTGYLYSKLDTYILLYCSFHILWPGLRSEKRTWA